MGWNHEAGLLNGIYLSKEDIKKISKHRGEDVEGGYYDAVSDNVFIVSFSTECKYKDTNPHYLTADETGLHKEVRDKTT